jgi:hypothetical protein
MLSGKLLWQSILAALIRFWDNRFHQKPNETIRILELELERERREKEKLQDVIISIAAPSPLKKDEEDNEVELKPIGTPHWRARAKQLEDMQRQKRAEMDRAKPVKIENMAVKTAEELEVELGVVNAD